jgi:hypothetical protein
MFNDGFDGERERECVCVCLCAYVGGLHFLEIKCGMDGMYIGHLFGLWIYSSLFLF